MIPAEKNAYHEYPAPHPGLEYLFNIWYDHGSYVTEHWHDDVEIIFVLDGVGYATIYGKTHMMGAGEFILINSKDIHTTMTPGDHVALLQLPMEFLERYVPNIKSLRFEIPYETADMAERKKIQSLTASLQGMVAARNSITKESKLLLYQHAFAFLHGLCLYFGMETGHDARREQVLERLHPLLQYTQENYTRPISTKEVAAMASLQPEYFCRLFKKTIGTSFTQYLGEIRLAHIYEDLLYTDETVQDILYKHGFTNYKVFRRMFRNRFGSTPGDIRRQKKQGPAAVKYPYAKEQPALRQDYKG